MNIYNQNLRWNWYETSNQVPGQGEPAIIDGIVQAVERNASQWTIDTHRVYVAGFSAGAAMVVILPAILTLIPQVPMQAWLWFNFL